MTENPKNQIVGDFGPSFLRLPPAVFLRRPSSAISKVTVTPKKMAARRKNIFFLIVCKFRFETKC